METPEKKVEILIEAISYLKKYAGKIFVIKYGGNAMISQEIKKLVMADIALLKQVGINPILVHGGGPNISEEMEKAKIKPVFVDGLRYTDEKTIEIVKRVSAQINKEITLLLAEQGCKAENLTAGLLKTKVKEEKLGLVGEIIGVDKKKLLKKIKQGIIPVVSPVGFDGKNYNNVNADTVATEIAGAINAEKLTILTDIEGVFENGRLINHLDIATAKALIEKKIITGGMIPKILACANAVEQGVKKAHLIDGTTKHSLLLEFFTDKGIGTEIVK
jgi:acetylglutamate kinase